MHVFLWLRFDINAVGDRQADRGGAKNIGDETEFLAVPNVGVGAGAFRKHQFENRELSFGIDGDVGVCGGEVEPVDND